MRDSASSSQGVDVAGKIQLWGDLIFSPEFAEVSGGRLAVLHDVEEEGLTVALVDGTI